MTEQQLDAEVMRYEPMACKSVTVGKFVVWVQRPHYFPPTANVMKYYIQPGVYERMVGAFMQLHCYRCYHTREAAFADLRNAIRLTGSNAAEE